VKLFFATLIVCGICVGSFAYAGQPDAGTSLTVPQVTVAVTPAPAPAAAPTPAFMAPEPEPARMLADPEADPMGFVRQLLEAVGGGKWKLLAALVLIGAVYVLRRGGKKLIPWLGTERGGVVLTIGSAVATGLALALASSAPMSVSLILGCVLTAAAASGIFVWIKKLLAPDDATTKPLSATPGNELLEPRFGSRR